MMDLKLFIDLDNVVYNLDKHVIWTMNKELNMNYNYKNNSSWWWLDTGVNKAYFENLLLQKGMFYNGDPVDESIKYINRLHEVGFEIYFISATQWNEYCINEKVNWLIEHFEWFDPDKHLIATCQKGLLSAPNRVLIDDSIENLNSWNKGIKICFGTNCNIDYKGIRLNKWCDVYNAIIIMEKGINRYEEVTV